MILASEIKRKDRKKKNKTYKTLKRALVNTKKIELGRILKGIYK